MTLLSLNDKIKKMNKTSVFVWGKLAMNKVKWLKNAVFYNIYPQSFYDTNGDGIGDLCGITEKLSYVKDMGFDAIWLNPFYVSPFFDAGYDVTDFYRVDARYGTNADFEALCTRAHELGLRVVIDLVAGHTSTECEWFKTSARPEKNEYSNRYVWTDSATKSGGKSFIGGYSERDGMYMKNYYDCQPALNYGYANIDDPAWQLPMDHPDCRATKAELIKIMEYWLSLGADGFRVDMAASVIKNDPDKKGVIAFWQEIRELFDKKYPECVLISEWSHPSIALEAGFHIDFLIHFNLPSYTMLFRAEKGRNVIDTFIGNSFFSIDGKGDIEDFLSDYLVEYDKTRGKGYISIPTGNHDLPRISYGRTKRELEVAYAFIMTVPGVPFVYYGDEIGMSYLPDIPSKEGGLNRTGSRTPMQWCRGKNAGFSTASSEALYLPVDEDGVNVEDQLTDENSLLNITKKLIGLRKRSAALSNEGEIEFLNRENGGYPLVYKRKGEDGEYLVAINPTGVAREFAYYLCGAKIIMQNGGVTLTDDKIELPPITYAIVKL